MDIKTVIFKRQLSEDVHLEELVGFEDPRNFKRVLQA
jgi:hypothetical protein